MGKLISQSHKSGLRNPWVIGWVAMVALVLGVNIFFVAKAFLSSPGLVSKNYYDAGRDLENTVQSRVAARNSLGWSLSFETGEIHMGRPSAIHMNAADKAGKPLALAHVVVHAYRPADAAADFSVPLAEKSPGQYVGDVTFPLKGVWDLVVEVKQGDQRSEVTRRIVAFAN